MEEFIYIILIAIWLLVSFLRKKPKKDQPAKKPRPVTREETPQPVEEEMSMEDMLEEFFGKGKKKTEEPAPRKEPVFDAAERSERRYDRRDKEKRFNSGDERRDRDSGRRWGADRVPDSDISEMEAAGLEGFEGQEGAGEDFAFASEGKVKTIDDLIEAHKKEEAVRKAFAEEQGYDAGVLEGIPDFDLRKAVIFSEILHRKYQ